MNAIVIATASLAGVVLLAAVGLATLIVHVGRGIRRDLGERIDREEAARRSDFRDLGERIDREEAARRSDFRDLTGRLDKEEAARRSDFRDLTGRMDKEEAVRRSDFRDLTGRMDGLAAQIAELRDRMSRVEGLLEGLRDAVTGRRAA